MDSMSQAQAAMLLIGNRARETNLSRLAVLSDAVSAATEDQLTTEARDEAARVAHQLVGSAGTFGFRRVSQLGRELELLLSSRSFADSTVVAAAVRDLTLMREDLLAGPDDDADED